MATPTRSPSISSLAGLSATGSPYVNGTDEVNAKLGHLATQVVTQTVWSRAQLKALGEEVSQLASRQEEIMVLVRAEEARRQNRTRSLAGQPLVPVLTRKPLPSSLPAITSLEALDSMSDSDLTSWYEYYVACPPPSAREAVMAALAAEVGLSPPPPPSYAQATKSNGSDNDPSSVPTVSKHLFTVSPMVIRSAVIVGVLATVLALSVAHRDNASLQNILAQIVQIIGQYLLKTTLLVQKVGVKMVTTAQAIGGPGISRALQATTEKWGALSSSALHATGEKVAALGGVAQATGEKVVGMAGGDQGWQWRAWGGR